MGHGKYMARLRFQGFQPGGDAFADLRHRLATVGCRARVGKPGLKSFALVFLQVADSHAAPMTKVAIAQGVDDFNGRTEQLGGLSCT
jgi:hypothetical protein